MAPHSLPRSSSEDTTSTIQKRSNSCYVNYTSECSTHRTVFLIIIILVGAFVGIILALVYARSRGRRNARQRAMHMHGVPGSGSGSLWKEGVAPAVRLPSRRVIGEDGNGDRVEQYWGKGGAWDARSAARFEAPPPYMLRAPEAARISR